MFVIANDVVVAFVANKFPADRAVDEAYWNCEATVVEVAKNAAAVGVLVAITFPVESTASTEFARFASERSPVLLKEDVAVAPKYALLNTENIVEEARWKDDATNVEVATMTGVDMVPFTVSVFRKSTLPATSKMLPVVEVATVPNKITFVGSVE